MVMIKKKMVKRKRKQSFKMQWQNYKYVSQVWGCQNCQTCQSALNLTGNSDMCKYYQSKINSLPRHFCFKRDTTIVYFSYLIFKFFSFYKWETGYKCLVSFFWKMRSLCLQATLRYVKINTFCICILTASGRHPQLSYMPTLLQICESRVHTKLI